MKKYLKFITESAKKELTEFNSKIFINKPTQNYFKTNIVFQVIFIDHVYEYESKPIIKDYGYTNISSTVVDIESENMIEFNRTNKGEEYFRYDNWHETYNIDEFNNIDFMTIQEFYNKYKSSYIRIYEALLDYLDKNLTEYHRARTNRLIDKLSIPEVKHIHQARKFNL